MYMDSALLRQDVPPYHVTFEMLRLWSNRESSALKSCSIAPPPTALSRPGQMPRRHSGPSSEGVSSWLAETILHRVRHVLQYCSRNTDVL